MNKNTNIPNLGCIGCFTVTIMFIWFGGAFALGVLLVLKLAGVEVGS